MDRKDLFKDKQSNISQYYIYIYHSNNKNTYKSNTNQY